jgi:hypothetical protein
MSGESDVEINVPLEKKKIIKEVQPPLEDTIENIKPKKEKKPRTEKQKTQFQEVFNKRKENIEKKKMEKRVEASKLLVQQDPEFFKKYYQTTNEVPTPTFDETDKMPEKEVKKVVKKKEPTVIELNTDEESEESVIIVKKKAKPKKKKKIIVEQSEDSSSGSDEEVVQVSKPKRAFVSQQNKKSVIKIHEKPNVSFEHYFV